MKSLIILFAFILFSYSGFTRDTVPNQAIGVDTVIIEKLRVDTVYVPVQEQNNTQPETQQPNEPQKNNKEKNKKVYYGGYTNFSFGKYTVIGFEPLIAYKLLPRFSVGTKISYEYFKNKNYSPQKEGSNC